jgi:hypothetical protein
MRFRIPPGACPKFPRGGFLNLPAQHCRRKCDVWQRRLNTFMPRKNAGFNWRLKEYS